MLEIIDFWWKPVGFLLILVALIWYTRWEYNRPETQARINKARYEEAHAYGPCSQTQLAHYKSEVDIIRRQEDIHDNCEGHALCDLVSRIEYDYREQHKND